MSTRRQFLKKALYATPAILSVAVRPAHACHGYQVRGGGGTITRPPKK